MRNRVFAVLAIAILAGGGLAYGTYNVINGQPVKSAGPAPTQPVIVAASDVPLGAELKADDVKIVNFPKGQAPEGAYERASDVVGRGVIVPLVRNEIVIPAKLASKEAGVGLPPVIPDGMRAVSVRVNEVIGVAGYVLPGTRVDVLATASPTDVHQDTITKVILANVQVVTAGTRMEQDQEKGKPIQVTVVTLLVFPDQAERLALASTEGKIQLALRNPLDKSAPDTPGIRPATLMGVVKAAVPSRTVAANHKSGNPMPVTTATLPAAPAPTVEVIRGDKRTAEVIK
ncbi:MAG TPA: Flp pilus assembly protein CpaB [Vicinamibacterales bacterium]|jgi:pilus assembly protein CpaB